ncbi:MAG TPA: YCF48-related protein [Blastocatellia bacterium]|nr:YCF48-related protein [Blastocatellia bacterium]
MQTDKRVTLLVLILLVTLVGVSCKPAQQNSNAADAAKPKSARWVAQFRSPELAKYSGTNMAVIFYSSISVVSPEVVFVAGDMPNPKINDERIGVIVRTSDGGQSWTETPIEQQGFHVTTLNSIHFINPNEGWAVGAETSPDGITITPYILKTTNGGVTWAISKLNSKQIPTTVFFIDSNTGWMGGATPPVGEEEGQGGPSAILGTTDGGHTWQPQINLPLTVLDITFIDATNGWACGTKGAIYQTTDGGRTWNSQRSELEPGDGPVNLTSEGLKQFSIAGIQFTDAQNGFAAAYSEEEDIGRLLVTTNGGQVWTRKVGGDAGLRDVAFLNAKEGWFVPSKGQYIYHTIDGANSLLSEPKIFEQEVTLVRLGFADAGHVWAVGGGAIFYRVTE